MQSAFPSRFPVPFSSHLGVLVLGLLLATGASARPLADAAAGARRAAICMSCHGKDGHAVVDGYPHLAGQNRQYLEKAISAYRNGQRKDPVMSAMAEPLTDEEIRNIAAYFSTLP